MRALTTTAQPRFLANQPPPVAATKDNAGNRLEPRPSNSLPTIVLSNARGGGLDGNQIPAWRRDNAGAYFGGGTVADSFWPATRLELRPDGGGPAVFAKTGAHRFWPETRLTIPRLGEVDMQLGKYRVNVRPGEVTMGDGTDVVRLGITPLLQLLARISSDGK